MTEHDEERRLQLHAGVLQRPQDLRGDDVTGHANDEEFPETGVEHQFRWDARIAAAENRRVRTLTLREFGEDLLLHGGEPCFALDEPLISSDEPR